MKIKIIIICLLLISSLAWADNNVVIHINYPADTVYIGAVNVLEIWFENDIAILGMSLGFEFSSYTGEVNWDLAYGEYPPVNLENDMDTYWVGVFPTAYGLDNSYLPDSLRFDAFSIFDPSLSIGNLRKCMTAHFTVPAGESTGSFCVDNIAIPPTESWTFANGSTEFPPDYFGCVNASSQNPDCPAVCFPVAERNDVCGDVTGDGIVTLSDVIFMINYIYGYGSPPDSFITVDVNCNGRVNVGDVGFLCDYLFAGGYLPCTDCQ